MAWNRVSAAGARGPWLPALAAVALVAGCSGGDGSGGRGPRAIGPDEGRKAAGPVADRPGAAGPTRRLRSCPVTLNNTRVAPPGDRPRLEAGGNAYFTTGELWVALWPGGVTRAGPRGPDGYLEMKFPWWRGGRGRLRISGRRLDAPARPLRARVPGGYGDSGFQATEIEFPSPGCWRVRARAGRASLTFVTLVPQPGSATTGLRPSADRGAAPLRDCGSRAEGPAPLEPSTRRGDVAVGPIAFVGLARVAGRRGLEHYAGPGGYTVKSGALLRAGTAATLVVARRARRWAALGFASRVPGRRSPAMARWAVGFRACPAGEAAFGYGGAVGPYTGFAGGFLVRRPGCLPLEVRVAGRPPVRARVPLGVGSC